MMLQTMFSSPILHIEELHPGYEDHASNVWLVKTNYEEVIVRSSKLNEEPNNDFWWGCKQLFGIDPRLVHDLEIINHTLGQYTTLPIPKLLRKYVLDREYIVVEKLEGQTLQSFINQPDSLLYNFGKGLAEIHQYKTNYVGNPSRTHQIPLHSFHQHMIQTSKELIERFHSHNPKIHNRLKEFISQTSSLPVPKEASFVLIDMDPTQFLTDGKKITGLVDTEAYAIGPREFDLIGLEYLFTKTEAAAFRKGYETISPLPSLTLCREPYRYLYRLLSVQGNVDLDEWMEHPSFF